MIKIQEFLEYKKNIWMLQFMLYTMYSRWNGGILYSVQLDVVVAVVDGVLGYS